MTRWFYNDPLAAAWMAKHFGMNLYCRNDDAEMAEYELPEAQREYPFGHAMIDDGCTAETWGAVISESLGRRAYVHPDSLHLLEPVHGDVLMQNGSAFVWSKFGGQNVQSATIIQRNEIPFMWPEVEP